MQGGQLAKVESCMTCSSPALGEKGHTRRELGKPREKLNVRTVRRRRQMTQLLASIRQFGTINAASRVTRVAASTIKLWMEQDPIFRAKVLDAQADYQGRLEKELVKRAIEGYDEPMVSAGKLVTFKRVRSDDLLKVALKAVDPEKYTEKGRQIGAKMGIDKEGNKFFKVYEGFDPDSV